MAESSGPASRLARGSTRTDIGHALGRRMRQLRKTRGLSMQNVAARAGLSVGLISQIERGLTSPSLRTLRLMAGAMDLPVESLFTRPESPGSEDSGYVVRPKTRKVLDLVHTGITIQIISPDSEGVVQMFLADIKPGGGSGSELDTHTGEESGLVLGGQMELWLGDKHYQLYEGDSFRFSSATPHRYCNPGEMITRVQWVVSPPIYSMSGDLLRTVRGARNGGGKGSDRSGH